MTRERILDTRANGRVAVTCPAESGISYLMRGSTDPFHPWHGRPWWFWIVQFNRMIARGVLPRAAYRYCRMMVTGGCTRRDAIQLIAERDCGHLGGALEIIDIDDLPNDRTYRDAWRRSANGGPVWIDSDHAQRIDEAIMWKAYNERT
ncbi:hypothetical protein DLM45_02255 [Hyphomicrobium methylovorum]|uniref:hypothetical protein n=1 Tax=Hyphomicrobium methylovorum TaxID=84 RepID=UPI0015E6BC86|nr:hypothetical protein [Hyphomicrobium methylovorum]MBA2125049.1 hypothetical protein [Hyphomicrobium methylovorum]